MLIVITSITLTGCRQERIPNGYGGPPPIIREGGSNTFFIHHQFAGINANFVTSATVNLYFEFDSELHFVKAEGSTLWRQDATFTVYRESDDKELGSFVYIESGASASRVSFHDFIFLSGDYLYYGFRRARDVRRWRWVGEGMAIPALINVTYFRYEHYRFNLRTGENQSVTLENFFNKLYAIDDSFRLN